MGDIVLPGMLGTVLEPGDTAVWANFSAYASQIQLGVSSSASSQADISHLLDAVRAIALAASRQLAAGAVVTRPPAAAMRQCVLVFALSLCLSGTLP